MAAGDGTPCHCRWKRVRWPGSMLDYKLATKQKRNLKLSRPFRMEKGEMAGQHAFIVILMKNVFREMFV